MNLGLDAMPQWLAIAVLIVIGALVVIAATVAVLEHFDPDEKQNNLGDE